MKQMFFKLKYGQIGYEMKMIKDRQQNCLFTVNVQKKYSDLNLNFTLFRLQLPINRINPKTTTKIIDFGKYY